MKEKAEYHPIAIENFPVNLTKFQTADTNNLYFKRRKKEQIRIKYIYI